MCEILFRGKAIDRDIGYHRTEYKNGDWVYGLITRLYDERFPNLPAEMTNENGVSRIEVDYKTIGQYTGLTDDNGKKIFEGDIIDYANEIFVVKYIDAFAAFDLRSPTNMAKLKPPLQECMSEKFYTVIGNIHDNPELLKGE